MNLTVAFEIGFRDEGLSNILSSNIEANVIPFTSAFADALVSSFGVSVTDLATSVSHVSGPAPRASGATYHNCGAGIIAGFFCVSLHVWMLREFHSKW